MPKVSFTRALERFVKAPSMTVEGGSVHDCLAAVFAQNPTLRGYVLDDQGGVRQHVAIYVNGQVIRDRTKLSDAVGPQDEIYVFQALTGG